MSRTGWIAAFTALTLSACAGGFSPDISATRITAEPKVVRCTLEGHNFSQTIQTPVDVILPKEAAPITLTCGAKDHYAFVTELKPRFNEKVLQNLMLVSLTGMVVDMANGHGTKYPPRVQVHLEPSAFASVEARDRWYGRYRAHISGKWERIRAEAIDSCKADGEGEHCDRSLETVAANQAQELEALEQRRRKAHINVRSTAEWPTLAPLTQ